MKYVFSFVPIKVELKSVIFTSDHGVLTDYTNDFAGDGGTVFSPRGWTATGTNNPISQTQETVLTAAVTICVQPPGRTYKIAGFAPVTCLNFYTNGLTSSGIDQTITLAAYDSLHASVDMLNDSIDWSISVDGASCGATPSGPHKVYVTWGSPGAGPTLKRMDWACNMGIYASSITEAAEKFRDGVASKPGYASNPTNNYWNLDSWDFLDSGKYGDCITLAKLCCEGLKMIGIPAQHRWAYPTADGSSGFPAVSGSSCHSVATKDIQYQGETFNAKLIYPGNNFEGFFTINDPGVKAYTVYTVGGPFADQTYYYLQVLQSVAGTGGDQFWVWNYPDPPYTGETCTIDGVTVTNLVKVPGATHIPVPSIP